MRKDAKKPILLIFIAYVWTKVLLGLAITPYKSVREVTRNRVLLPVVFSPLYGLAMLFIAGRIGSFVFEVTGFKRTILALALSTGLLTLLLWQLLLVYLLLSFHLAFRKK